MQVNVIFIRNKEPLQIYITSDNGNRLGLPSIIIDNKDVDLIKNEFLDKFNLTLNDKKIKLLNEEDNSLLLSYDLNNSESKKLESEYMTNSHLINQGLNLDVLYCTRTILSNLKNKEFNLSESCISYLTEMTMELLQQGTDMKITNKKATLNDFDIEKIKQFFSEVLTDGEYHTITEGGKLNYVNKLGHDIEPLKTGNFKIAIQKLNESFSQGFNYNCISEDLDKLHPLKRKQYITLTAAYIAINSGFLELTIDKNGVLGKIGENFPETYVKICQKQQELVKHHKPKV